MSNDPLETPLMCIVALGSVGAAFFVFYRNWLYSKEQCTGIQTVYAWTSLLSAVLTISILLCSNNFLFLLNTVVTSFLLFYFVASIFSGFFRKANAFMWSDFFLISLYFFCMALKTYAMCLLKYRKSKTEKQPTNLLRPIPKAEELDLYGGTDNRLGNMTQDDRKSSISN